MRFYRKIRRRKISQIAYKYFARLPRSLLRLLLRNVQSGSWVAHIWLIIYSDKI